MTLRALTKPQHDAAREAALSYMHGNPNHAEDRAKYQLAKARLSNLLPAGTDADECIRDAVRWEMKNVMSEAIYG